MKIIIHSLFLLVIVSPVYLNAQDTLRLEEALTMGLSNNLNIQISKKSYDIAQNELYKGNAGLLPTVGFNAGYTYNVNDTRLEFAGDNPGIEQSGAESTTLSAAIEANYTIFDGFGNRYNYQILEEGSNISRQELLLQMESISTQIHAMYFTIANLQENFAIAQKNLSISRERLERLKRKYDYAAINKLDLLNARVDFNRDSSNHAITQLNLENTKTEMNMLLGREPGVEYAVQTQFDLPDTPDYKMLEEKTLEQNREHKLRKLQIMQEELRVKRQKSDISPSVSAFASYGYNRTDNEASFILLNRSRGLSAGLNLNFTIFNGNQIQRNIETGMLSLERAKLTLENTDLKLKQELLSTYNDLQYHLLLYKTEKANLEAAKTNFNRAKELYQLGQITSTRFREAQLNLQQSEYRLKEALYEIKKDEIELKRITGELVVNP